MDKRDAFKDIQIIHRSLQGEHPCYPEKEDPQIWA